MNTEGQSPFADYDDGSQQGDDLSATVADVFGLDIAPEPKKAAGENEPSVGTEGGAGAEPSPGETPAPFSPPTEDGPGSAAPAQPAPAATPQQGQPGQTPPPPQAASDPRDLQISSLTAQLQALQATVQQLQAPQQQPQGATPPPAGQQDGQGQAPAVEPINVQLPQQITDAIFGDDPALGAQALNTVVSTLATGLTHRFKMELAQARKDVEERLTGLQQQGQQATQEQEAARHREDYFARFPDHNKPIFHSIVATEAAQLAAELPGVAWDEKFRDALGARVTQKLMEAGVQLTHQPAAPAPSAPVQQKPAAMVPTGTRPTPEPEDANIIADTMSFY